MPLNLPIYLFIVHLNGISYKICFLILIALRKEKLNADITSLVNFDLYKKYFNSNGLISEKVINQSEFLKKMGIIERVKIAGDKMGEKEKIDLYSRVQRLIDPSMMGNNFKVIFTKNKNCNFSLAFK